MLLSLRSLLTLVLGGSLLCGTSALAQKPAQKTTVHRLPAHTRVQGTVLRRFCEKDLRVGDTISARIGPENGVPAKKVRWPKELLLVLRRTAPRPSVPGPQFTFEIYSAKVNGVLTREVRGALAAEPESVLSDTTHSDTRCYDPAIVFGQISSELRFR